MKRRDIIRHLESHGCRLKREGASHTPYVNPASREMQAIPRHSEIADVHCRKICQKLSVPDPKHR